MEGSVPVVAINNSSQIEVEKSAYEKGVTISPVLELNVECRKLLRKFYKVQNYLEPYLMKYGTFLHQNIPGIKRPMTLKMIHESVILGKITKAGMENAVYLMFMNVMMTIPTNLDHLESTNELLKSLNTIQALFAENEDFTERNRGVKNLENQFSGMQSMVKWKDDDKTSLREKNEVITGLSEKLISNQANANIFAKPFESLIGQENKNALSLKNKQYLRDKRRRKQIFKKSSQNDKLSDIMYNATCSSTGLTLNTNYQQEFLPVGCKRKY